MKPVFNPSKKSGTGSEGNKIRLGQPASDAKPEATGMESTFGRSAAPALPDKKSSKTAFIAAGVVGAAALVGGIYAFSDSDPKPAATQTAEVPKQAEKQPHSSIEDKLSLVNESDNKIAEAFLKDGKEVSRGKNFDLHVALYNRGGISVLVASGVHAGTRINFLPVTPTKNPVVTYEKVGLEKLTAGKADFYSLPTEKRIERIAPMRQDAQGITEVGTVQGAREFTKILQNKTGKKAAAFKVSGTPEKDGLFSVQIWNGDKYSMSLKTGEFTINSTFANSPEWHPGQQASREKLRGKIDVSPVPAPIAEKIAPKVN